MSAPVAELLEAWSLAVRSKDLEGALALWWSDGIFAGSSQGEVATGTGVAAYLTAVLATDHALGWTWEAPVVRDAGGEDPDLVWFHAEGTLHVTGTKARPYRCAGVLRRSRGEWRFAMWAGSEPA